MAGLVIVFLLNQLDVASLPAVEVVVSEEGVLADEQEDHIIDVVYYQAHHEHY